MRTYPSVGPDLLIVMHKPIENRSPHLTFPPSRLIGWCEIVASFASSRNKRITGTRAKRADVVGLAEDKKRWFPIAHLSLDHYRTRAC